MTKSERVGAVEPQDDSQLDSWDKKHITKAELSSVNIDPPYIGDSFGSENIVDYIDFDPWDI